ncbi:MAG: YggT family protein [Clostridiales bacterium]|nr:YggT family protein [Clostridiales bacterium]
MNLIFQVLNAFIYVLMMLMFARAISSWFVKDLSNPIVRFLFEVTEPMISPVRNLLQKMGIGGGMFDFSFIIVYLILIVLQEVVLGLM